MKHISTTAVLGLLAQRPEENEIVDQLGAPHRDDLKLRVVTVRVASASDISIPAEMLDDLIRQAFVFEAASLDAEFRRVYRLTADGLEAARRRFETPVAAAPTMAWATRCRLCGGILLACACLPSASDVVESIRPDRPLHASSVFIAGVDLAPARHDHDPERHYPREPARIYAVAQESSASATVNIAFWPPRTTP